jgi:methionyl-tRNA synthetase
MANGARLSKSAGVWIDLDEAIARHGADALRYFLLREIPFETDGDFTWARFDTRYTADLANTLGNLTSRVSALASKHCEERRVPRRVVDAKGGLVADAIRVLDERASGAIDRYVAAFDAFRPHEALAAVFDALVGGNELITRVAPWALAADPTRRDDFDRTITAAITLLAQQAVLLSPAIPGAAERLWQSLGAPGSVHDQRLDRVRRIDPTGWRVTRSAPLFPRA